MVDWKKEIVNDLKDYAYKKKSLQNIPEQIDVLEEMTISLRSGMSGSEPVSGGTSKAEDNLISNICKRERLEHNYTAVSRLVKMVDDALNALNHKERLILDKFYINRTGSYLDDLCEELGYEKTAIYEIKDVALKNMALTMYGIVDL